jgi:predicted ATPase
MLPVPSSSPFTLEVRNLRALRHVRWTPRGICALVGSNGTGKSTLLLSLEMLRFALEHDLPDAVTTVLGGSINLRSWDAPPDEPVELGISIDDLSWSVRLVARGPTVAYHTEETLKERDTVVLSKDALGNLTYAGKSEPGDVRLGLRAILDRDVTDARLAKMEKLVSGFSVYLDPDLAALRWGSKVTEVKQLHRRGANAIAMLRRWFQERPHRHRYEFVLHGLRTAFPKLVHDLDFQEAGQTLAMQVYAPGHEQPSPIASEANGTLAMMVLLCDVAAAEPGGIVAIDEPENSLHPYAIRAFLEAAEFEAQKRQLTIILATHSPTLLDRLAAEQIYVMDARAPTSPVRLDEFKDKQWLANFRIGELFMDDGLTPPES